MESSFVYECYHKRRGRQVPNLKEETSVQGGEANRLPTPLSPATPNCLVLIIDAIGKDENGLQQIGGPEGEGFKERKDLAHQGRQRAPTA